MILKPEQAQMLRELDQGARLAIQKIGNLCPNLDEVVPIIYAKFTGNLWDKSAGKDDYEACWSYKHMGETKQISMDTFSLLFKKGYLRGDNPNALVARTHLKANLTSKGWDAWELVRDMDMTGTDEDTALLRAEDNVMGRFARIKVE